jgi:hypothetical protein
MKGNLTLDVNGVPHSFEVELVEPTGGDENKPLIYTPSNGVATLHLLRSAMYLNLPAPMGVRVLRQVPA